MLLTSCSGAGTGSPPTGASRSSESGTAGADMAGVIFVVPLEGAPTRTALILADAIAAEIRDTNHPAILSYEPNQAGASVVGKVVTADMRGNVIWLGVDWAIRAPYGTHVASYSQHVVIDAQMWRDAAPEGINLIIADAAPRLAEMVNNEVGPPVLAAMHRREDNQNDRQTGQPQPELAGPVTTMQVREQEMQATHTAAPETVQPLACIA